jgi:hypothetical protein
MKFILPFILLTYINGGFSQEMALKPNGILTKPAKYLIDPKSSVKSDVETKLL